MSAGLLATGPLLALSLLAPSLLACTGEKATDSGGGGATGTDAGDSGEVERTAEEWVAYLGGPGPYAVGFTVQEVTYTDPAGDPRTLALSLWYPTDDTDGDAVVYLDGVHEADGVLGGATIRDGRHPTLVWSHGSQAYAGASAVILENLASHGWLVASPEHTTNTIADGAERATPIYYQRPADISAVIDHLASDWADHADLDHLVGGGHSFGGYGMHAVMGATYDLDTLLPQCEDGSFDGDFCNGMTDDYAAIFAAGFEDDRMQAVISMGSGDWNLFGDAGLDGIDVPGFWVTGDQGYHHAENEAAWTLLQGGPDGAGLHRRAVVEGAGHNFCTDLTWAVEPAMPIDDEEGWRIARVLTAAWARRYALGDTAMDPILDGEVEVSTLATIVR
ncbi:MAG: hypothetical protein H6742_12150 [Alphaproteobacteria bacterium]|nr:hypothetical protein [Alphaproteobacteria bacterium]